MRGVGVRVYRRVVLCEPRVAWHRGFTGHKQGIRTTVQDRGPGLYSISHASPYLRSLLYGITGLGRPQRRVSARTTSRLHFSLSFCALAEENEAEGIARRVM